MVGFRMDVHPVDAADETWRLAPHQHYWRLTDGHFTHRDEA